MIRFTFSKTACAVALSALLCNAQAKDIPEVVVTAKADQTLDNVHATAHVITQAEIEKLQAQDLPALLASISGLSVRDSGGRGSVTSVFVRGAANSQTIVLIDGVRVGSATLGEAALNTYPVEAIERIEVIKGPLAGIYGADAVGGVIHIFTKKGNTGGSTARLKVGSDSLVEYGIGLQGAGENYSFHVSANAEDTDGIDRTSIKTGGNDDEDGYEESAYSLGFRWTPTSTTTVNLSVLYSDNTAEFDNTFGSDVGDSSTTETLSTALQVSTQLSDNLHWSSVLGINEDQIDTFSSFPSSFTTERDSVGTELGYSLGENHSLTVGADYYDESIVSTSRFPIDQRDNKGAFALLQSDFGAFSFLGSLRYDDNSAYGSDANTSLALNYNFDESTRLVVSHGTGFAAPSFNFLYFPFFGNPDLQPEESESLEVSLQGRQEDIDWRISFYDTQIENLFSFDPATFLAANVGAADLQGMEIEVAFELGAWQLGAQLDLLSAKNKDTGVVLDDRAEQTIRLNAQRDFDKFGLRMDVRAENNRFDNGGQEISGHLLFDARAYYNVAENVQILAKVENVFDQDYTLNLIGLSDRYLTQGRQASLTIQYEF